MNTRLHANSPSNAEAASALRWHFDEQFPEFAIDREWDACSEVRFLPTEEPTEKSWSPGAFRAAS